MIIINSGIGIGIIGTGMISEFHARAVEAQPDGKIIAVSSRSKENVDRFAAKHNCDAVYDWREMIKREDIQAVAICRIFSIQSS